MKQLNLHHLIHFHFSFLKATDMSFIHVFIVKMINKKVLFDIDDLVIDTKYINIVPYVKNLSDSKKTLYNN